MKILIRRAFCLYFCAAAPFAPALATATPTSIDQALDHCLAQPDGMTTQGMIECIDAAQVSWDAELNRLYKALQGRLDGAAKTELRGAQRAWLAFRDQEIRALGVIYANLQGTMYRTVATDAVMQLTKSRVEQLDAVLSSVRLAAGEDVE